MNTDSKEALSSAYRRLRQTWEFTVFMANVSPSGNFYSRTPPIVETDDLKRAVRLLFEQYPLGDHFELKRSIANKEPDELDEIYLDHYAFVYGERDPENIPLTQDVEAIIGANSQSSLVNTYISLKFKPEVTEFERMFEYIIETQYLEIPKLAKDWSNRGPATKLAWSFDHSRSNLFK